MNNFDHAVEATSTALNSSGSAMQENSRYMESLEARTNQLKATFQDLANNVIESELVKSVLDLADGFLTLLNTPIGTFVTQVTLLTGALFGLQQLFSAMNIFNIIGTQIKALPAAFSTLISVINGTTTATAAWGAALNAAFPILAAISVALVAIPAIVDAVTVSLEEQKEIVSELQTEINGYKSEIETLEAKQSSGDLTSVEQSRLDILKQQLAVKQSLYDLELQRQYAMEQEELGQDYEISFYNIDKAISEMGRTQEKIDSLDSSIADNASTIDVWTRYYNENKQIVLEHADALAEDYERALEYQEAGIKLSETDQKLLEEYPKLVEQLIELGFITEDVSNNTKSLAAANQENSSSTDYSTESLSTLSDVYNTLSSAVEEYNSNGSFTIDTIDSLLALDSEYLDMLTMENGKLVLNSEALYDKSQQLKQNAIQERIAALSAELYTIATEGATTAAENAEVSIGNATDSLSDWDTTVRNAALGTIGLTEAISSLDLAMGADQSWLGLSQQQRAAMEEAISNAQNYINLVNQFGISAPGGSGGKTTSAISAAVDPIKEQNELFEEQVEILDHELFLMEKQGASEEDRISKLKEIQAVLHDQANWYREQGLSENSEYIRELQKQWWNYQDEIDSIYEEIAQAAEEAAQRAEEAWKESLEAQIEELEELREAQETAFEYIADQAQKEIDALEQKKEEEEEYWDEKIDALKKQNEEIEDQLELEKALMALAAARQKKVMVYKDGRFQYISDIDEVSSAQEEVDRIEREQAYEKELERLESLKNQAIQEIEDQIKNWEQVKEDWGSISSDYQEEQDKITAEEIFGIDLDGDNWKQVLDKLEEYKNQYIQIMEEIKKAKEELEAGYQGGGLTPTNPIEEMTAEEKMAYYKSKGYDGYATIPGVGTQGVYIENGRTTTTELPPGSTVHTQSGSYTIISGTGFEDDPYVSEKVSSYANGTMSAKGGISLVGENGPELRLLNKNDSILPNDFTQNLFKWGSLSPSDLLNAINGLNSNKVMSVSIQTLNLPEVHDTQDFLDYFKNNFWRKTLQLN